MPTILEAPKSDFIAHPEGSFLAVCRDTYLETRPNPWKGLPRDSKDPSKGVDERDEITEIHIEFLTEHPYESKGDLLPSFVKYQATASLADNSNLRKFLKGWFPALKDEHFQRFDADKLIGRGAYITVAQNVDKKGNVWAKVIGAMQPPKDSSLPMIPKDFVRHEDKQRAAAPNPEKAPLAAKAPDLKLADNSLPAMDKYEAPASATDDSINPW